MYVFILDVYYTVSFTPIISQPLCFGHALVRNGRQGPNASQ